MTEKEFKELKVKDVLAMPLFLDEMQKQIDREQASFNELCDKAVQQKMRVKRFPMMSLIEKGVMTAEKMTELYSRVLDKTLVGFSSAERQYIYGVGFVAFGQTLTKLKEESKT